MRKRKNWPVVFLSLLLTAAFPAAVYAEDTDGNPDKTLAPYFFVEGNDASTDHFPLKDTEVTANIDGIIADIHVTQTYANEGKNAINARYIFPASTKASVHGMTMQIADKKITAKIKEKEEAKEEFTQAKNEGKSASLLEEERPNVFTMNVANIIPGDTVVIDLHYSEMIDSTDGSYQWVFPTVVGPRYMSPNNSQNPSENQWVETPYLKEGEMPQGKYAVTVNHAAGVPISHVSCKSHDINIQKSNDDTAQITLANPEDYAGNRDFILNYDLTGQDINCGLMLNQGPDSNFFMLMVQPPNRYEAKDIPPRDYIFVLDVSGSMYGYPLDTAKELMKDLTANLRTTDTFNVILFSGASSQMSPGSIPATAANVQRAMDFIDQEDGAGGTELAPALKQALAIPKARDVSRSIITITDGYIDGEKDIFNIINKNLNTANFFSFGVGDSVNRYLIDGIAKVGQGEAFVVTDPEDAKTTARNFSTYIQAPLLTDVNISYDGFDAYDVEPQAIPTLFAQRPIVLYGKWKGGQEGTIHITGKAGSQDYVKDIPVSQVTPIKSSQAISYLWARTKVANLTDYYTGDDDDNGAIKNKITQLGFKYRKNEITQLGLKYSMITPYTSFVAVMEEVRSPNGSSQDVDQPQPLPQGVSNYAVGNGYTIGSEPGVFLLVPAAVLFVSAHIFIRNRKKRKSS